MKHLSSKNPTTSSDTEDQNPNPNLIENESKTPFVIDNSEEDLILSKSHILTRIEVTRQRKRKAEQLYKVYDDYLWALSEEYRLKYREYYWNYGKSPFKDEEEQEELLDKKEKIKDENGNFIEGTDENGKLGLNENGGSSSNVVKKKKCDYIGCKSKPMALTTCCHSHILSDPKQTLYKACNYIVKRSEERPVHCGKPILRASVPSLCTVHFEKAEVLVTRALKKAGLNISSANVVAPKLHVIVAESVRHINSKRRERRTNVGNGVEEEDDG
ncbi:Ino80 complex subunit d-like protein [Thalictrum thalictroides]|uniref:KAT8 regulatory NSL complex subunit 2 n=1 Tax=Thalictrum thalictroides TaxID=46969 RepID=A0A7J6V8H9_THATH|nr:Ino80 complex subunit d-like protein [Thalictrum thalictroides]